jgi:hypothetical protein
VYLTGPGTVFTPEIGFALRQMQVAPPGKARGSDLFG